MPAVGDLRVLMRDTLREILPEILGERTACEGHPEEPCPSGKTPIPHSHFQGAGGVAGNSATRLDLQKLEEAVQFYFTKGLAQSTLRTYRSGKDRYLKFCSQAVLNPLPVSEQVLCSFVSHLAQQGLKYRTIKVYLSAVRHLQIAGNYPDPFGGSPMPKLEYVLRGVKKHEGPSSIQGEARINWQCT